MTPLLYLDTNIYLDYFQNRSDGLRPLGEFAFQLIQKARGCAYCIAVSSLVIDEIRFHSQGPEIGRLLSDFELKGKLFRIDICAKDRAQARLICNERKTPFNDTLHMILARRLGADILVTRNTKDFVHLRDFVQIALPEIL